MAVTTTNELRGQVIYCVYVRQYGSEGNFEAVRRDLPRIRALGADIVWLMPVCPIGESGRKGSLGSPYAIRDFRAVDPLLGTMEDFRRLTAEIHALGMKCLLDVVYHHTSPDSVLAETHPEWFWRGPDGRPGSRIGDWTDVIDLDYSQPALWDYQIETLRQWAADVDGFRCDVAPLMPLEFWLRAREAVAQVRPGCIFLAESVEPSFLAACRARGVACLSDAELYQAFDLTYEYDVYWDYVDVLTGKLPLSVYAERVTRQETLYPENYGKLRVLENHDRPRAAALIPDERALRCWTAFLYFQKGTPLLYNGQEVCAAVRPSLFDRDPIDWETGRDLTPLLQRLSALKRLPILRESAYEVRDAGNEFLFAAHRRGGELLAGVFPARGQSGAVRVPLRDGVYRELIRGGEVRVDCGVLTADGEPLIFFAEE